MSRDNMLPFSGYLKKINARSQTPIVALLVFGVIDLGVMFYGYRQPSSFNLGRWAWPVIIFVLA